MKFPLGKFNYKLALVGALALGSLMMPQISSYLGALSAVVESQPQYNSSAPVVEFFPGWGCTHTSKKVVSNVID